MVERLNIKSYFGYFLNSLIIILAAIVIWLLFQRGIISQNYQKNEIDNQEVLFPWLIKNSKLAFDFSGSKISDTIEYFQNSQLVKLSNVLKGNGYFLIIRYEDRGGCYSCFEMLKEEAAKVQKVFNDTLVNVLLVSTIDDVGEFKKQNKELGFIERILGIDREYEFINKEYDISSPVFYLLVDNEMRIVSLFIPSKAYNDLTEHFLMYSKRIINIGH